MSKLSRRVRRVARRRSVLMVVLVLLGAGAGVGVWALTEPAQERKGRDNPEEQPVVADVPPPKAAPTRAKDGPARRRRRVDHRPSAGARVPARPPRLEIPAIGVRAHAIPLATMRGNKLEVPRNWSEVGWWQGGSLPGQRGVSVVVGHVDSKAGPAVFYRLRQLSPGDEIRFVRANGDVARFRVTRKERYPKRRFPTTRVYAETSKPALRLITCGGNFDWSIGHYRDNVVVYAEES